MKFMQIEDKYQRALAAEQDLLAVELEDPAKLEARRAANRLKQKRHRRRKGVRPRDSDEWKLSGDRSPMKRPEVRAKLSGDHNPAKRPEVRAKISAAMYRGTEISYGGAHDRASKVLPKECEQADETCKGRLEAAFRPDAPKEFTRSDSRGRLYYVGPNPMDGYSRLCASHHKRCDKTRPEAGLADPLLRCFAWLGVKDVLHGEH